MISVESAHLSFAHNDAVNSVLENISFHIEPQQSCAIIGPSGCGKTSLLFLLAGLLQPDSGRITLKANLHCGTILQNFGLFPWKTVYQNIALGLLLKGNERNFIKSRVDHLIDEMGLSGFDSHYPGQLSGGMQQRVALARALAIDPEVLFMDEPLSSLDALTRERLQALILELWHKKNITTVLVTHSIEEAVFLGQRIIVLSGRPGRILKIVENSQAGDNSYRQSEKFFQQCISLRNLLQEEYNGQ